MYSKFGSVFALLAFAMVLALPGCGSSGGGEVQLIDLLELLPPDQSVEYEDPSSPVLRWSFAGGLPRGWTAGPEGVTVRQQPEGIQLVSPDHTPPWVEIRTTIDLTRYRQALAVTDTPPGQPVILFYSTQNPPRFRGPNRIRKDREQDRQQQPLELKLPDPDAVDGPLRALRLHAGLGRTSAAIEQLVIQPRQKGFLKQRVLSRSRIGIGHQSRHCWRIPGNGTREVDLRLPDGRCVLSFALGTLRGHGPAELTVDLLQEGKFRSRVFQQVFPLSHAGWQDVRADLNRWSGKEVSLRFTVRGNDRRSIRLIGTPAVRTPVRQRRPSVLLVVLDAQRADRLSLYGHDLRTSPHLSRLAGEGILFSAATAPCSWTMPSVVATFTGRQADPQQLALGHGGRMTDRATLAQLFSGAGYATAGFSGNCLLTASKGFARGFDTWHVSPPMEDLAHAGELNRRALQWLRAHREEETFSYLHYMDPHAPYDEPWPEPPAPTRQPDNFWSRPRWQDGYLWHLIVAGAKIGPAGVRKMNRLYERGSSFTDHRIGRLLAVMKKEGLLEGSAVLVTADHGDELHDHGYWGHGSTLYQEVLHVPLLLRLPRPGPEAGTVVHAPVSLVDVAPTLTAIAGIAGEAGWSEGRDMRHLPADRTLYSATTAHAPLRFSVIRPPWKYIFFDRPALGDEPLKTAQGRHLAEHGQPAELLFNLEDDPGEREDLTGQRPEVAAELRGLMESWFAGTESGPPGAGAGEPEAMSEEDLERLRALGYVQ